jgi:hypothetical protein
MKGVYLNVPSWKELHDILNTNSKVRKLKIITDHFYLFRRKGGMARKEKRKGRQEEKYYDNRDIVRRKFP